MTAGIWMTIAAGLALAGPAVPYPAQVVPAPVSAQVVSEPAPPLLPVTIVARYPHDRGAFTEGLAWHDGQLYESVGQEGRSEVRRVRLADGRVLQRTAIAPRQFGEGLAIWRDDLVTLTWHDGIAYRWNAKTLQKKGMMRYPGEGWGLTSDSAGLILSDGTTALRFLDPVTLAERRRVTVTIRGRPLDQINELERVDGALLANVWRTGFIVRIDPATGRVTAVIDLRPLITEIAAKDPEAVPNGIAYDPDHHRLFVTGKLWPTLFEIKLGAPAS